MSTLTKKNYRGKKILNLISRLRDRIPLWRSRKERITTRQKAEEAAKRQSALLNVIFENLPDQIYYMDRHSRLLGVNQACCTYHNRTEAEMIGKTDLDFLPDPLGKRLYDEEQQLMAEGRLLRKREKHVKDNGRVVYLESVKSPLRTKSGRIIGLVGISRDITQQVENEESLIDAKKEAEHAASFIRALFDHLEDQFYYKDRRSRVMEGNKAWLQARGVSSIDELLGKTDLDLHPAPLGQQLYDSEQRQMETGETKRARERHVLKNGDVQYLESIKCPMKNEQGEVIGLAGISRDITQQVKTEQALVLAKKEAQAAVQVKSDFLSMMSHEIRTPLNAVLGYAQIIEQECQDCPAQKDAIPSILKSGQHLLNLINDILEISRTEGKAVELLPTDFDFHELLDSLPTISGLAKDSNTAIRISREEHLPRCIHADQTKISQILINLVNNAIKFTDAGRISISAGLAATDSNGALHLYVDVQDSGCGISSEDAKRIFDPFEQASSNAGSRGGTGLGLSLSRRYARAMGGDVILLTSTPDEGSTFRFSLAAQPAGLERPIMTSASSDRTSAATGPRPELTAAEIRKIPQEQLDALCKAVRFGRIRQMRRAVGVIETGHPEAARELVRLIDGYEYAKLIRILDKNGES